MTYRVKLNLWKLEGQSAQEVKKHVCELLKKHPEKYITVEPFTNTRPLWKRIVTGK